MFDLIRDTKNDSYDVNDAVLTRIGEILVREDSYAAAMDEKVIPFLNSCRTDKYIEAPDSRNLHVVRYDQKSDDSKGTVLIVHGFTESTEKYREFIYYLLNFGFSVVIYDQRGHGFSYREVPDKMVTHIDRFETYVSDLEAVVSAELSDAVKPLYLFAHSMGGAVSGLYLEKHPDCPFKKAILSSPMIAPERGGFPLWLSKAMAGTFVAFGQKKKRMFLSKVPEGREKYDESASSSEARFEFYQDVKLSKPEYSNNGPSYGWTLESLKVTKKLLKKGEPEKIKIPVMLFVADGDNMVIKDDIEIFCDRIPNGALTRIEDSKHEIFFGKDTVLIRYLNIIIHFISEK